MIQIAGGILLALVVIAVVLTVIGWAWNSWIGATPNDDDRE